MVAAAVDPPHQGYGLSGICRAKVAAHMRALVLSKKVECHNFSILRSSADQVDAAGKFHLHPSAICRVNLRVELDRESDAGPVAERQARSSRRTAQRCGHPRLPLRRRVHACEKGEKFFYVLKAVLFKIVQLAQNFYEVHATWPCTDEKRQRLFGPDSRCTASITEESRTLIKWHFVATLS